MPNTGNGRAIKGGQFVTATTVCLMDTVGSFPCRVQFALALDPTSLIFA